MKTLLISIAVVLFLYLGYWIWDYEKYLRIVEAELNSIENVDHITIDANRDTVLEEILADIYLKNKGEISIFNANSEFRFGWVTKIGRYSAYEQCDCSCNTKEILGNGLSVEYPSSIFDGKVLYGHTLSKEVKNTKDLVECYDEILFVLDSVCNAKEVSVDSIR